MHSTVPRKVCRTCGESQPHTEYYVNLRHRDGLATKCKTCTRLDSLRRKRAERGQPPPEVLPSRQRGPRSPKPRGVHKGVQDLYGMSSREYRVLVDRLYAQQNGLCAICQRSLDGGQQNVDHCHTTMAIRGLLCALCNRGLGLFNDDPTALEAAAAYVRDARDERRVRQTILPL